MRKKHTRLLSAALTGTMTFSMVPVTAYPAFAEVETHMAMYEGQVTKQSGTDVSNGAVKAETIVTIPFGARLEDTEGALIHAGVSVVDDDDGKNMLKVTAGWNNANQGHAEIADARSLFGRTSFTLLANVKADSIKTEHEGKAAAFSIGTEEASLHILTDKGTFGYGDTKAGGGVSAQNLALSNVDATGWNALAVVYEEKEGANGSAAIYINGEKAGEVADLGFRLSAMSVTANIGRSFHTNFLLNGLYDNIVVEDQALTEAEAMAQTKERQLAIIKPELEQAVTDAEEYLQDNANAELQALVDYAKTVLADPNADVGTIAELTEKINSLLPEYAASVVVKGSDVDAAALMTNGLTYKGWGLLSCNGTSNLLMDYKAEAPEKYWEMIDTLFGGEHPLISHVKIEMGNDGNTSTAADPATIRYEGEEADASRSPGWQLAADARSVNPNVKISVLRWRSPNWTEGNTNTEKIYQWYRNTIFDAYEKYGILADYIAPGVNEARAGDIPTMARMAREFNELIENETEFPDYMDAEAQEAYHNTKIISADEIDSWAIVDEMYNTKDQEGGTWEAADALGIHYVTGTDQRSRELASKYNKEFWYSEGCANFGMTPQAERSNDDRAYVAMGGEQSPLAIIDGYLNAFVFGNMTHYVFQPAIGAFYDGLQYAHKDLVSAREPWAGYMRYDEGLYMTAHFTQFSKAGWPVDEQNSNGIWLGIPEASDSYAGDGNNDEHLENSAGKPSYMTLAAPDKSDFSVVAVNNSPKDLTYKIKAEDMNLGDDETVEIWQTKAGEYMEFKGEVQPNSAGVYVVTVEKGAVATFTTLDYHQEEGDRALTLPAHTPLDEKSVLDTDDDGKMGADYTEVTDNDILYADDFEYEEEGTVTVNTKEEPEEQDYLASRGNEPRYMMDTHGAWVVEESEDGNNRLGQILDAKVSEWNNGDPETIVGDHRWMNYKASVDVQADNGYALLGIRQQTGMNSDNSGYNLKIDGSKWELRKGGSVLQSGQMPERKGDTYNIALEGRDNMIIAYVDGQEIASYIDVDKPYLMGRVFFGSSWVKTYFDNLKVEKIPGYVPYARAFFDDHDTQVQYGGSWTLSGPGLGNADNWYRSLAANNDTGEGVYAEFSGNGTGFALVGENGSGVVADIYVDGTLKAADVANHASNKRYSTMILNGLEDGEHEFKVVVKSGKLTIDGVYILGKPEEGGGNEALQSLIETCEGLLEEDYTEETWEVFQTELSEAKEVLEKEQVTQVEIDRAVMELRIAKDSLIRLDQPVEIIGEMPQHLAAFAGEMPENLPETVTVKLADGETAEKDITWTLKGKTSVYETPAAVGTVEGSNDLKAEIPVEMVPESLVYFIDAFSDKPEAGAETPVYTAVRDLVGDQLKNDAADQISDGTVWGFNSKGVHYKGDTDINDKYNSGYYMGGGNPVIYYLPLEAGTYTLTVGAYEWWEPRSMKATVSVNGNDLASDDIVLSNWGSKDSATVEFTLSEAAVAELKLEKVSSNDPVVSWLAVAQSSGAEDQITGIRVEKMPEKQIYRPGEDFDPTGMVIMASKGNGEAVELADNEYAITGFDSSKEGEQELTVTYVDELGREFTTTFFVTISEAEYDITKIKITEKPDKMTYYVGEDFDPTGMKVEAFMKATNSNAIRKEIEDYEVEYDFTEPGKSDVVVLYEAENAEGSFETFTDSITVKVLEEDEFYTTKIRVKTQPDKKEYEVGEPFDPTGMEVINVQKGVLGNTVREEMILYDELDFVYDFSTPGNKKVKIRYYGIDNNMEEKVFLTTVSVKVKGYVNTGDDDDDDHENAMIRKPDLLPNGKPAYAIEGIWKPDGKNWKFIMEDGRQAVSRWICTNWNGTYQWYYFDQDGNMTDGWQTIDGQTFYLQSESDGNRGQMVTGWKQIDGEWYYFNPNSDGNRGVLLKNTVTDDGYKVDETGRWIQFGEV